MPLTGNVTCVGLAIGAVQLDSVVVPAGASCNLQALAKRGALMLLGNTAVTRRDQCTGL